MEPKMWLMYITQIYIVSILIYLRHEIISNRSSVKLNPEPKQQKSKHTMRRVR